MRQNSPKVHNAKRTALALLLAAALLLGCAGFGWAVDLLRPCSVTVSLGNNDYSEALREASLEVDLYYVAGAVAEENVDSFHFQPIAPYTALELGNVSGQEQWQALAQQAMSIALSEGTPIVTNAPVETPIRFSDGGAELLPGLYLMLVHGKGVSEIATPGDDGQQATVAYAGAYRYLFAPELLSLPTKEAAEDGTVSTGGPGEWLYDVTAYLKPEQEPGYGSLEIIKTLHGHDGLMPATFIFEIEAVLDGRVVFSDVRSMFFTHEGVQSIVIENLPIGAEVTVTELYSGVGYGLESPETQVILIQSVEIQSIEVNCVEFTNRLYGTPNHGGAIDNHFAYEQDSGWTCEQIRPPQE